MWPKLFPRKALSFTQLSKVSAFSIPDLQIGKLRQSVSILPKLAYVSIHRSKIWIQAESMLLIAATHYATLSHLLMRYLKKYFLFLLYIDLIVKKRERIYYLWIWVAASSIFISQDPAGNGIYPMWTNVKEFKMGYQLQSYRKNWKA